jgi:methylenetetrahydrofolate--tRNA-(uracil-5-)-methyltransferase
MLGKVNIIGGGLAGCEAAWQSLMRGCQVTLYEMRPHQMTPAHKTENLAELVCSNSFKSLDPSSASGLLKSEMTSMNSLIMEAALATRVPAGQALAIDRIKFSGYIESKLRGNPNFILKNEEISSLPSSLKFGGIEDSDSQRGEGWIIATGPLTSTSFAKSLDEIIESVNPEVKNRLYFYDAIAPTIAADSIDWDLAFMQSRYDKGGDDYVNLPLNKSEYDAFVSEISKAEYMPLHEFESTKYFESCLPVEVMVSRGHDTLRFGPMKPVGLIDPKTQKRPWAVVQLRKENLEGTMYSMVGFQTKMKWPEQKRVFSMIPALRNAEFYRFGSVHRNTYVQSPVILNQDLSFRGRRNLFLAGQITGVEGYLESAAMGLLAGLSCAERQLGKVSKLPPETSMIGALLKYVTNGGSASFQPMNSNFGILPSIAMGRDKKQKRDSQILRAKEDFRDYWSIVGGQEATKIMPQ